MKLEVDIEDSTVQQASGISSRFIQINNSIGDLIPDYATIGSVKWSTKPIITILAVYGLWKLVNR